MIYYENVKKCISYDLELKYDFKVHLYTENYYHPKVLMIIYFMILVIIFIKNRIVCKFTLIL